LDPNEVDNSLIKEKRARVSRARFLVIFAAL